MNLKGQGHPAILQQIARRVMLERGFLPDFSTEALAQLAEIQAPQIPNSAMVRDLRGLLWASIDNDDSRDLDQLSVAEEMSGDTTRILVAIADVDSLVEKGSGLDEHAGHNTTTIYTVAQIFPMFLEKLSTDLTSLGLDADRLSVVVEIVVGPDGSVQNSDIYRAYVRNRAKLAYSSVAAWLDGSGEIPPAIAAVKGLGEKLRLQDRAAQRMKKLRQDHGALTLETIQARAVFDEGAIRDLEAEKKNRAKDIIEDFMIAANGVTAQFLTAKQFPSIRRVVRTPKRWERIVAIAQEHSFTLPDTPDAKALEEFLTAQQAADPLRYPDLSLSIIKLIGAGEYVAKFPGESAPGHFGLAVKDYTHSTAPNRRFTDVITQRLLKAALQGKTPPYGKDELVTVAAHCTKQEDAANKVERQVGKSAAALLLESRIGEQFEGIVTGAAPKGTWVRLLALPVEGRLSQGYEGADVGNRIRVQLVSVDVQRGFIDFKKVSSPRQ